VANLGSNTVSVIDTASNTVVATVQVESAPIAVAITPDGTHAFVTNNGNLSVIATATKHMAML
jgi:YVTN family beta-propeller protein